MMRPKTCPVTSLSTGVFTHSFELGATGVGEDAFDGTTVAPALSPCQPLDTPTSRCARRSLEIVMRPPRFGTSCHRRPLDVDISIGLTTKNEAMYCALPLTRGASPTSVMSALCSSIGSSAPKARPVIASYAGSDNVQSPAALRVRHDSTRSTTMPVTPASAEGPQAANAAAR